MIQFDNILPQISEAQQKSIPNLMQEKCSENVNGLCKSLCSILDQNFMVQYGKCPKISNTLFHIFLA